MDYFELILIRYEIFKNTHAFHCIANFAFFVTNSDMAIIMTNISEFTLAFTQRVIRQKHNVRIVIQDGNLFISTWPRVYT